MVMQLWRLDDIDVGHTGGFTLLKPFDGHDRDVVSRRSFDLGRIAFKVLLGRDQERRILCHLRRNCRAK